jgi:hypothetical protein
VQRLEVQLLLALDLDEPHRRTRGSLRDRLRIAIIVLVSLEVGPHILRRHQPDSVAKVGKLATEMMGATTGLHSYRARRQTLGETHNTVAPHPPTQHHPTRLIEPDDAAAVLAEINPENRDVHDRSLLIGASA